MFKLSRDKRFGIDHQHRDYQIPFANSNKNGLLSKSHRQFGLQASKINIGILYIFVIAIDVIKIAQKTAEKAIDSKINRSGGCGAAVKFVCLSFYVAELSVINQLAVK